MDGNPHQGGIPSPGGGYSPCAGRGIIPTGKAQAVDFSLPLRQRQTGVLRQDSLRLLNRLSRILLQKHRQAAVANSRCGA